MPIHPELLLMLATLKDNKLPKQHRRIMLRDLLSDESPAADALASALLDALPGKTGTAGYEEKCQQVDELLHQLQDGPLRQGVFLYLTRLPGAQTIRPTSSSTTARMSSPRRRNAALAAALRRGDRVLLDGKGRAVIHRLPTAARWARRPCSNGGWTTSMSKSACAVAASAPSMRRPRC